MTTLNVSGVLANRIYLTADTTLLLLDGTDAQLLILIVTQDSTGGHALTISNSSGLPSISTSANASTVLQMVYDSVTGNWIPPAAAGEQASKIQTMRTSHTPSSTELTNLIANVAVTYGTPFADTNYTLVSTLALGTISAWVANHVYATDAFILDPNGNIQAATTGGTSGATIPTFSAVDQDTTSDNSVTWTTQTVQELLGLPQIISKSNSGAVIQIVIGSDANQVPLAIPFILNTIAIHD